MAQPRPADGVLSNWPDLQRAENFAGLLVGNGSSRAVWEDFAYTSLLERAREANIEHLLPPEARGRFEQLETADFETVLTSHRDAERGSAAIGPVAVRI
jgi:hypothetical protein